jgi:hypothetical protein
LDVGADAFVLVVEHRTQVDAGLGVAEAAERRKFRITEGFVAGNFG